MPRRTGQQTLAGFVVRHDARGRAAAPATPRATNGGGDGAPPTPGCSSSPAGSGAVCGASDDGRAPATGLRTPATSPSAAAPSAATTLASSPPAPQRALGSDDDRTSAAPRPGLKRRRRIIDDDDASDCASDSDFCAPRTAVPQRAAAAAAAAAAAPPRPPPSWTPHAERQARLQHRHESFKEKNDERYSWLQHVRDTHGNPPGSPNYDPRTIFIPPGAFSKFSPFEKQYWEIKKSLWDTILFFQKGKFHELYETDATIGHQEFDLKLTDRVNMRMVGVPETKTTYWASQFIAKGYKVAIVSQSENQISKEMREKSGKVKTAKSENDKVIRRQLECILTRGTLVDGSMLTEDTANYCMALKEITSTDNVPPAFGICFVDTATGLFQISSFQDDSERTKLDTLVNQINPKEILLEKGQITPKTIKLLKNLLSPLTLWNYISPGTEFWDEDRAVSELERGGYFDALPTALRQLSPEAMSATGALVWYLRYLKLDRDLISMGNFTLYDPMRRSSSLVLDGQTLKNLEVFQNSFDCTEQGTLFKLMNRCVTPFGKRLFRNWICHPLQDPKAIDARLDAVDALNRDLVWRQKFVETFRRICDLERMITRVHAGKCNVKTFVNVINGFQTLSLGLQQLNETKPAGSQLLNTTLTGAPDIRHLIETWEHAFDFAKALDEDIIVPELGVEPEFDASQQDIADIIRELEGLLTRYRKELRCSKLVFRDLGKELYQVEVPAEIRVPQVWRQLSSTSKVRRYYTPELEKKIRNLLEARERHKDIVATLHQRFCARFDEHYTTWMTALKTVAILDCLVSLAQVSNTLGEPSCRPEILEHGHVVDFYDLRHPYIQAGLIRDFIPNDITLGGDKPSMILLTGANMAGKSTILRQTCIAVIMAQLGCYVPARSAKLSPVDRIMSRLGANDNIFASASTFMVELTETKKILTEATERSLVILDELGRGTSTHDGMAVAYAVLHHLATHVGCLGFFATHYCNLGEEFADHPEIAQKRMAVVTEPGQRKVIFLYRLEPGVSEKSYGLNVASMASVPLPVVERAETVAQEFEAMQICKNRSKESIAIGMQVDLSWIMQGAPGESSSVTRALKTILGMI